MPRTPSSGRMKRFIFTLPEDLFAALATTSKDTGESVGSHVRRAVMRYLDHDGEPADVVVRPYKGKVKLLKGALVRKKGALVKKPLVVAPTGNEPVVLAAYQTPSEQEVVIPWEKAKRLWKLTHVPGDNRRVDVIAHDVASRLGLKVVDVTDFMAVAEFDELLMERFGVKKEE